MLYNNTCGKTKISNISAGGATLLAESAAGNLPQTPRTWPG